MVENKARISIRVGAIEIEYEGDRDFLNDGLVQLINSVAAVSETLPAKTIISDDNSKNDHPIQTGLHSGSVNVSTATIAAHYHSKSATDLAICAMAHLELVKGQASNDRSEILKEMKTATAYYKDTMAGNNAANLKSLAKAKRVNDLGGNKYALNKSEREKFEALLDGIE